jgi:PD-(D/E)XK endonuclease
MSQSKGASRGRRPARWPKAARKKTRLRAAFSNRRGEIGEAAFVHEAMRLGFVVARPYGQGRRYDFMVEGGHKLWRIQVKTCGTLKGDLYRVNIRCKTNRVGHAYSSSDVDFVVVYIMPEQTWYVLPIRAVAGRTTLLFRPEGYARPDAYARYREAWHLMGKPDGPAL